MTTREDLDWMSEQYGDHQECSRGGSGMSDDLVKRLRSFDCITMDGCGRELRHEAADRIEELERKLAKVVEGLHYYACNCVIPCEQLNGSCGDMARTALAELKGEDRG